MFMDIIPVLLINKRQMMKTSSDVYFFVKKHLQNHKISYKKTPERTAWCGFNTTRRLLGLLLSLAPVSFLDYEPAED